jgi:acyl carrier protein
METKILNVIKRTLELDSISEQIAQENCEKWDSINHLMLIVELESEFACSFEPEEIAEMQSFYAIKKMLLTK